MKIQIVVTYFDSTTMYYPVPDNKAWRVDAAIRCIVIGKGLPRQYVPLDKVRSFDCEEITSANRI